RQEVVSSCKPVVRTLVECLFFDMMQRAKISKASADLVRCCEQDAKSNPLLMGIPVSDNPFKNKKS
uniref:Guanine nucleotide-binding protein subunit gamma n=1 Tax=Callorhinchus milii TaxID=7868 RepID=A0A4W3IEG0_CALMI